MTGRSPGLTLRLEKLLPASVEQLFEAFVDPLKLGEWWGPHGYRTSVLELAARPGGVFRLEIRPPEGELFHLGGEFVEVDPAGTLGFTFVYEEPTPDDQETVVHLSFDPAAAGGTSLVVRQAPFRTEERRALHEAGWTETLERLEAFVA